MENDSLKYLNVNFYSSVFLIFYIFLTYSISLPLVILCIHLGFEGKVLIN